MIPDPPLLDILGRLAEWTAVVLAGSVAIGIVMLAGGALVSVFKGIFDPKI